VPQSVDMIPSLRNDYGRVEVDVLDVNLLPNKIESVVIGDRLFTLPIQVEGRDDAPPDQHMEVDNNNDENGGSGEMKELETNNEQLEQSEQGNNGTASSHPPHSKSKSDGKQTDEIPEVENASEDEENYLCVSKYPSSYSYCPTQLHKGNPLYFSKGICKRDTAAVLDNNEMLSEPSSSTNVSAQAGNLQKSSVPLAPEGMLPEMQQSPMTPLRRSKRRVQSIDEHSLERAERVKAKKNLEELGMSCSKSVLTFTDSQIPSNISELGISLGSDMHRGVCKLKNMEMDRLVVVQNKKPDATNIPENLNDDSDMGFDH
jgi:hypothetical protein